MRETITDSSEIQKATNTDVENLYSNTLEKSCKNKFLDIYDI